MQVTKFASLPQLISSQAALEVAKDCPAPPTHRDSDRLVAQADKAMIAASRIP
jgi:hypothetical protein